VLGPIGGFGTATKDPKVGKSTDPKRTAINSDSRFITINLIQVSSLCPLDSALVSGYASRRFLLRLMYRICEPAFVGTVNIQRRRWPDQSHTLAGSQEHLPVVRLEQGSQGCYTHLGPFPASLLC
jgi:hypothetical protein